MDTFSDGMGNPVGLADLVEIGGRGVLGGISNELFLEGIGIPVGPPDGVESGGLGV